MSMNDYSVRGRVFRTGVDYQAALRDEKRIELILKKYDNADKDGKENIVNVLNRGEVKFETLLGDDFLDELDEIHAEFLKKSETDNKDKKKKIARLKEKKSTVTNDNKKETKKTEKIEKKKTAKKESSKLSKKEPVKKSLDEYDPVMQEFIKQELYIQEKQRRRTVFICSLIAVVCLGYVFFYYYLYERNSNEYEHLASLKTEDNVTINNEVHINYTKEEEKKELIVLEKYKKLFSQNKSLIGWIKIDDTNIDYPVMQTVNNEYYLDHNYNQQYDKNGSIFLDKDCDITNPGTNMIIYGHHMKSGKMFGNLKLYSNKDYFEKHRIIQFDTIYEEGRYEVMYVFRSRIYNEDEIVFKYYQFFDVATPEEFDSNMAEMAKIALYDTGVTAKYGDKLITLSTCDNSEQDGRFVVVAKKIN